MHGCLDANMNNIYSRGYSKAGIFIVFVIDELIRQVSQVGQSTLSQNLVPIRLL